MSFNILVLIWDLGKEVVEVPISLDFGFLIYHNNWIILKMNIMNEIVAEELTSSQLKQILDDRYVSIKLTINSMCIFNLIYIYRDYHLIVIIYFTMEK